MTAAQLTLSFDAKPLQTSRGPANLIYLPFDADQARQTILEQLRKAGGDWVRRIALRRATGMHPQEVGPVIAGLVHAGVIEETDTHQIIHPAHGFMGHTHGYRIGKEKK